MQPRVAALTGATGFLGRRLAMALATRGWRVRALVRRPSDRSALEQQGISAVLGDLADRAALRALTDGAEVTVHCAGLIKSHSRAEFFAVNRDGAARVAAASDGPVLLVSSLAAREPALSDYAASKRAGEDAARDVAGGRLVVLRPPVIYGPGDRETLALFLVAGRWPIAPVPADRRTRLALAHADDVAAAVLDLVERPRPGGVFAVGGDRPTGYGWREIMAQAAAAMGRKPWLAPVPAWAITAAASLSERIGAAGRPPIFTRGKAREMLHADWSVSVEEMAPDAPAAGFSLPAGFADTVRWYRTAGWL
jgi:nucleoside-diphosphate-sugar epimerase